MRYVALLGSINVGGNKLLMEDLRAALEREEFQAIETVVASGNVLFSHEERPSGGLAEKIAWVLEDRFDIDSTVVVLTRDELADVIAENPFGDGDEAKVHTLFLSGQLKPDRYQTLVSDHSGQGPERMAAGTRALHVDYVEGVGRSKLTGAFVERRLGLSGTARNLRSMKRILKKMEG